MSYLEHFNLSEQPFRLTPDPDFLYWSMQHARAKAYMESTIWLADGFVVITGEIGSGKTTLLQSFLTELDDDVVYAVVSQTQLTPTQFLQAVLAEFGFTPFDKRKVELLDILNNFLIEQYSNGKKVLLIVDEAQNLSTKVLEEVRMLSGIETHKEKVLRIILAGQPELKETLETASLKQLLQRVRLKFHLGPLDLSDVREYVAHRLAVAGSQDKGLFSDECFDVIFTYTGGIPRLVNSLCDTALLIGFAHDKKSITPDDIMAAVDELDWKEHEPDTGRFNTLDQVVARHGPSAHVTQIEIMTEGETVAVQTFGPGRIIIGRSPDNEICIKSKFVSRHHAQLVIDEKGCVVEDLNSTNGVFFGERQIKKHLLTDGDSVAIGAHDLVYTDLRDADENDDEERDDELDDDLDDDGTSATGAAKL